MAKPNPIRVLNVESKKEHAIARALRKLEPSLRKKANFVGYGVGRKRRGRRALPGLAAILFVKKKVPRFRLASKDLLPSFIIVGKKRIRTDVRVLSSFRPLQADENRKRHRPVQMGSSIAACPLNQDAPFGTGTAGARVHDAGNPNVHFLLSAGHVMKGQTNDLIQPGGVDGGHNRTPPPPGQPPDPKDNIGDVLRVASGGVDGGIAEVTFSETNVIGLGSPTGPYFPVVGMPVQKSGRRTGITQGRVTISNTKIMKQDIETWRQLVPQVFTGSPPTRPLPGPGKASMDRLFYVEPAGFGDHGDSGSLIMAGPSQALKDWMVELIKPITPADQDRFAQALNGKAIGLLIGTGNPSGVLAQGIKPILRALAIKLD
jgi:hypothetical protein